MATRRMYNRRAIRPDAGFYRDKRRGAGHRRTLLEGSAGNARGGLIVTISSIIKRFFRRRV